MLIQIHLSSLEDLWGCIGGEKKGRCRVRCKCSAGFGNSGAGIREGVLKALPCFLSRLQSEKGPFWYMPCLPSGWWVESWQAVSLPLLYIDWASLCSGKLSHLLLILSVTFCTVVCYWVARNKSHFKQSSCFGNLLFFGVSFVLYFKEFFIYIVLLWYRE